MIQLSEIAAQKIKSLIAQQSLPESSGLRIYANSGCCSNDSYGMALEVKQNPEDNVFITQGIRVLMDQTSYSQLDGASVDYYQDEHTEGFKIEKLSSDHNCECGGGNC